MSMVFYPEIGLSCGTFSWQTQTYHKNLQSLIDDFLSNHLDGRLAVEVNTDGVVNVYHKDTFISYDLKFVYNVESLEHKLSWSIDGFSRKKPISDAQVDFHLMLHDFEELCRSVGYADAKEPEKYPELRLKQINMFNHMVTKYVPLLERLNEKTE